jgi:hypothetical protein
MSNPTDILGTLTILLDDDYVPSVEGASLEPGGFKRTTKSGDQVHGPTQTAAPSRVTARFPAQNGVDETMINAFRGGATFQGDNGVTWSIVDLWCLGDAKVTAGPTGEISATFEGKPAARTSS